MGQQLSSTSQSTTVFLSSLAAIRNSSSGKALVSVADKSSQSNHCTEQHHTYYRLHIQSWTAQIFLWVWRLFSSHTSNNMTPSLRALYIQQASVNDVTVTTYKHKQMEDTWRRLMLSTRTAVTWSNDCRRVYPSRGR